MRLGDVKFGTEWVYSVKGSERTCVVITCDPDDGASLIAEFRDENGDIYSGDLFRTEAGNLEPAELSDYMKYRGKCKEMSEAAVVGDPDLTLVRGHYFCPIWGTDEPHWWTTRADGTIYDPSAKQFASKGNGIYSEFGGVVICEECGAETTEEKMILMGNYPTCSDGCAMRLVGL